MSVSAETLRAAAVQAPSTHTRALRYQRKRGGRPRVWLKILASMMLGSLVAFVLLEIIVRVADLDVPRVWEPDPILGWRHIPGAKRHFREEGDGWIQINRLGFRDRERTTTKP